MYICKYMKPREFKNRLICECPFREEVEMRWNNGLDDSKMIPIPCCPSDVLTENNTNVCWKVEINE